MRVGECEGRVSEVRGGKDGRGRQVKVAEVK